MIVSGGPVFWILLVLVIVELVTYFERLVELRRAQLDCQDFIKGIVNVLDSGSREEALAICEETTAPVASVVATAIRQSESSARVLRDAVDAQGRSEIGRLDRRLAVLAIIVQIAPLLGLLGTVIGLIRTVMTLNAGAIVSRAELMSGAMEALVTAALGLAVAIPGAVMYSSLRVRLERIVVDMESAASQILGYISAGREERRK